MSARCDAVAVPILLFVRVEGEPYACLGRLRAANCTLDRNPVMIEWELLDYDALIGGTNSDVFKGLLEASK